MADLEKDLREIASASDEDTLSRIEKYQIGGYKAPSRTGIFGQKNAYGTAMEALERRRAAIQAERGAADAKHQGEVANLDGRKNNLINSYADQARRQLTQGIVQNTKAAQGRGLLYSGLKQGADQRSFAQAAGDSSNYQAQVNRATDQDIGGMEVDRAQEGLNRYKDNVNVAAKKYQNDMKKSEQGAGVAGAVGSAAGGLAGMALPF
jgi:hypothetical protein